MLNRIYRASTKIEGITTPAPGRPVKAGLQRAPKRTIGVRCDADSLAPQPTLGPARAKRSCCTRVQTSVLGNDRNLTPRNTFALTLIHLAETLATGYFDTLASRTIKSKGRLDVAANPT